MLGAGDIFVITVQVEKLYIWEQGDGMWGEKGEKKGGGVFAGVMRARDEVFSYSLGNVVRLKIMAIYLSAKKLRYFCR